MRTSAYALIPAALAGMALAQLGGLSTQEWSTSGGDAQRSNWIRKDALISKAAVSSGKFGFLWKVKVNSGSPLSNPALVANAMGYQGFRSLIVFAGSSNTLFAVDDDFGRMDFEKRFDVPAPSGSTPQCPGGMTAAPTRLTNPDPAALASRGAVIRSPYRSALSDPGQGAVVDSPTYLTGGGGRANAAGRGAAGRGGGGRGGGRGRSQSFANGGQPIIVLAGDGVLHFISPTTQKELLKPASFLPANAHATDLAAIFGVVYTATVNNCGGVPNAVWAIDPTGENPQALSWKTNGGNVAGTLAFGGDATVYAALDDGNLVALDPQTLAERARFTDASARFSATPVVFRMKGKEFLAATTADGRILLFDTASLTAPIQAVRAGAAGFASWEDDDGVRWLLAATKTNIAAYRMTSGAKPSLESAWVSKELTSAGMTAPLTPIVVNGTVFAAAARQLHALDGATGKELWNSGNAIASAVRGTGLASSEGQVYLATEDNTVYTFGMPYERQ